MLGKPMGEAVRSAFNVQPVTEAFFKDCKAAYEDAVESLAQSIDREDAEQFAQTLFNHLMFIHFASRKGWRNSTAIPTISMLSGRTTAQGWATATFIGTGYYRCSSPA